MMPTRGLLVAGALVALAVSVAGPSPVGIAAPQGPTAGVPGYAVVSSTYSSPAHLQSHGTATCPTGTVPLGGGVEFASTSVKATVNSSYPQSFGWVADVNNATALASAFTVYAVCATKPPEYERVDGAAVTVYAGSSLSAYAVVRCRHGNPLAGGVFSDSSNVLTYLQDSFPYAPAYAWNIAGGNQSTQDEVIRPWVVCGDLSHYQTIQATDVTVPAHSQGGATAFCRRGVPVGGGIDESGGYFSSANSTYPVSGGWRAYQNNQFDSETSFSTWVVCAG